MTHWTASVVAILLASLPDVARAQNCAAIPAGPARTDCYIGSSRIYGAQSDIAAGKARVQSDAARLQQVTGTKGHPRAPKHRPKRPSTGRPSSIGSSY